MICALEHIPLEHLFSFFVLFHPIFWFYIILLFRHVNLWRILDTPHTHTHFAIRQASLYSFLDNFLHLTWIFWICLGMGVFWR